MEDSINGFYETCLDVARQAGELVKEGFHTTKTVEMKENFADLVTATDQAVEELIIGKFSRKYKEHKFIGEESVAQGHECQLTDDPTWIIDPIDGTTNFVHGIPHTSISIALAVNKEVVLGVVYCPMLNEMFSAVKGKGAYCNDQRLHVSTIKELQKSTVILEGGSSRDAHILSTKINNMRAIIENSHGIRSYGSAAIDMCYVARGWCEAYLEHGIHVWDIAAGKLIVEEAGGNVKDPSGDELDLFKRRVLASCTIEVSAQISNLTTNIQMDSD